MSNMDIVYILGNGSRFHNLEIMLSLRSIDKAGLKYRNIFIVGEEVPFLKDIVHIPFKDPNGTKEYKIAKKIEFACNQSEISDDFLFFNDDFFITRYFDIETFPYYQKGTLLRNRNANAYNAYLNETYRFLKNIGKEANHFDLHLPIIYNKKKFIQLSNAWHPTRNLVVKSTYSNYHNIVGPIKVDYKIKVAKHVDTECFSTYDDLSNGLLSFLFQLYPTPSKFEKDKTYILAVARQFFDKEVNYKRTLKEVIETKNEARMAQLIESKVCKIKSITLNQ